MTGLLIRVPGSFNNPALPRLVDYDVTQMRAQITNLPGLRAFYDFTDPAQITKDGANLVSQVNDLSGNDRHATASGADRPTFVPGAINGIPMLQFSGAQKLLVADLFSGGAKLTVAMGIYASTSDGTSRMLLADADDNGPNFYLGSNIFRSFNADAELVVSNLKTRITAPIFTANKTSGPMQISIYEGADEVSDTTVRPMPVGGANIGGWNDAVTSNRYMGFMGHLIVLDQDASESQTMRDIFAEYSLRKYRTV